MVMLDILKIYQLCYNKHVALKNLECIVLQAMSGVAGACSQWVTLGVEYHCSPCDVRAPVLAEVS